MVISHHKNTLCQFHQHFTHSFCMHRSQKCKKDWQLDCIFVLLGSVPIKAANKMLVKSQTTGDRTGLATGSSLYKKHVLRNWLEKDRRFSIELDLQKWKTTLSLWSFCYFFSRLFIKNKISQFHLKFLVGIVMQFIRFPVY